MTDQRMDQIIGNLLRTGVILAAAVVAAGGLWYLAVHGAAPATYRHFHDEARGLKTQAQDALQRLYRQQCIGCSISAGALSLR